MTMAEVQSQPISRPSKQKVSLDGFLACGGKIDSRNQDGAQEQTPTSIALNVCDDVQIDALLTAAKNDKLPLTPTRKSKPRSDSLRIKAKQQLGNNHNNSNNTGLSKSAHTPKPKPLNEGMRRSSDGKCSSKKQSISRSQSFDKPEGAEAPMPKRNSSEKINKRKSGVARSKSFDGDNMQLKRIPRNVPRGNAEPKVTRERPARATSERQGSQRKLGEKQGSRRKLGEKQGSQKDLRRDSKEKEKTTKRRSRSGQRQMESASAAVKRPSGIIAATALGEASLERQLTEQTGATTKSSPDAFPAHFPQQDALGDAAFEATFGEPNKEAKRKPLLKPEDEDDSDSDCDDNDAQEAGIMQFDPTAADNVVLVRQDSGIQDFPSCPVELDISLSNHDVDESQDQPHSPNPNRSTSPEPPDQATTRWGKFFHSKLKKSNSFKSPKNTGMDDTDATEPTTTSIFNSLFSGSHHMGYGAQTHQQLDDDETLGDSIA